MECLQCGFENLDGMKFCGECGTKLNKICPTCNFSNPPNFKFCGECGHNFEAVINLSEPKSYTPNHLADKILTTRSSIEGERKLVTVLFADVANYSSISEKLDPEEVHQIMDGCFKILMDEIHKYEGTINQFTGDGVMALFGAPVAHEDHAQRACRAAISIQTALKNYSKELVLKFDVQFEMRIGLNSGLVVVASIGDDLRMDYTAVGDTTNLAARMESHAKPGTVLLSEKTQKIIKDFFELEPIGEIVVKGKERPQKAYRLIRIGDIETRFGASQVKGLTRFVGRKNSIKMLLDAYNKAKSGNGQVVGIVGEAGVGKSRLLLEMRNAFSETDYEYHEGRCLQYGRSIIYLPILDIIKSIFEIKVHDKEYVIKKKIKSVLESLSQQFENHNAPFQDILSLSIDDREYSELEPKNKRERIFEAIRDILVRIAQDRPLVMAVEDLHWIDKTSEDFLNYFIEWIPNSSILLIVLYRSEYTNQWGSRSYYTKIGVDHLGVKSSGELVTAIFEEEEIAPELRELILNRSAGNPLFMEEFTHTLLENGVIEKRNDQYLLNRNYDEIDVPDTIHAIIAARLDRLEENLKRTMQVASVIGRDFAFRILQTITGMQSELKSHLLNLQGLEFIYEKRLFPELEYIFKHALTQEVAYNSLLQKRRKEIHENIGQAIENLYADRIEEFYEMLSYHYSKSRCIGKGIKYFILSGNKAMKNHSLLEAYEFYTQGINLITNKNSSENLEDSIFDIFILVCVPMRLLGYPENSLKILNDSKSYLSKSNRKKELSLIYSELGVYFNAKGRHKLAKEYFEDSYSIADKTQDIRLIAPISLELIVFYFFSLSEIHKSSTMARKTIDLIEQSGKEVDFFGGPLNIYSTVCGFYGAILGCLGEFNEGEKFCKKALAFASKLNDIIGLGNIGLYYGLLFIFRGDGAKATNHLLKSLGYFKEKNWIGGFIATYTLLGWSYLLLGNNEKALQYATMGLNIAKATGVKLIDQIQHNILAVIYLDNDDIINAKKFAESSLSNEYHETIWYALSKVIMGKILWKEGSSNMKVLKSMRSGINILEERGAQPCIGIGYYFLGEYLSNVGNQEAKDNLIIAEKLFKTMENRYWYKKTKDVLNKMSE